MTSPKTMVFDGDTKEKLLASVVEIAKWLGCEFELWGAARPIGPWGSRVYWDGSDRHKDARADKVVLLVGKRRLILRKGYSVTKTEGGGIVVSGRQVKSDG